MEKEKIFQELEDFKHNFAIFYDQRRQNRALMNFVGSTSFRYESYLQMIDRSLKERFLDKEEIRFLNYMVKKTGLKEIRYSTWTYKKQKIKRLVIKDQIYMDFGTDLKKNSVDIPLNLLLNISNFKNNFVRK